MTKGEYRNKSNSHFGNGSRAKPDYKRPHQQSGYNFQKVVVPKSIIDHKKPSKLVRLSRGA